MVVVIVYVVKNRKEKEKRSPKVDKIKELGAGDPFPVSADNFPLFSFLQHK